MATISASMVKELREKTGAGMMECKKALQETGGDLEQAVDELRKRGQARANKRSGRSAKEGLIMAKVEGSVGVLFEINCETDFVARNDEFIALGAYLADLVHAGDASMDAGDAEAFANLVSPQHGKPVGEVLTDLIAKVGENMGIGRFARVDASQGEGQGRLTAYIHPPGKLGVLIELRAGKAETLGQEAIAQLGHDLAMHVAAAAPVAVDRGSIPADEVEREQAIYRDQVKMEGKPEKIWDKIVEGKLAKFYKENCLLEQGFVKDPDTTIKNLLEGIGKELDDTIQVKRFERFVVGGSTE